MDHLSQELRWGLRSLGRNPVLSTVAVVTLALGIGANTAVFSVVHALLLKPLPYAEPHRLVAVWPEMSFNKTLVRRIGEAVPALEGISGISNWTLTLTGGRADGFEPEELLGSLVSVGHFELLGVQPALGRSFRPEEARPGEDGVAILSHGLWMRRFGGDPAVLGRIIPLAGAEHESRTVVGVMPESYRPVAVSAEAPDLWVPLADPEAWGQLGEDASWYVNWRVGRLAPGASLERARAQLRAEALRIYEEGLNTLDEEEARTADLVPLGQGQTAELAAPLWLLMGTVGLVLLIACGNVANLLLARGEARERELTVRRALGAGRLRIARQLLAESLLLGLAGGALGVSLAYGAVALLARHASSEIPRISEVAVDGAALTFAVAASMAAVFVFGALPALRGSRQPAAACLRSGGSAALGGSSRPHLHRWLVAAQVALAVVVVVASGLMLRSLHSLYTVDPGFTPDGVLAFRANPPATRYRGGEAYNQLYDRIFERLRALPGVRRAGAIQLLPLTSGNWGFPSYPEGMTIPPGGTPPMANFRVIRPGYFETVRIPLLAGRHLTPTDGLGEAPKLALVNQTLAREFWPEVTTEGGPGAVLGKEIRLFGPEGDRVRVVGVVGDVRQFTLDREPLPEMFVTAQEWSWEVSLWIVLRTEGDPLELATAVRQAVWSVDPDVPVSGLDRMDRIAARSAGARRFVAALLVAFGLLALALGSVGVFGVTSYTVARRLPELGLRKALGATPGGLLRETLGRGLEPVAAGVVLGIAGALAASRLLASLLYGVEPRDPVTLVASAAFLLAVGAAATALPAWRASRVDPMRVLREE